MDTVKIPMTDLAGQYRPLRDEYLAAIAGVMDSTQFILGQAVTTLERSLAAYCGAAHAIGVASGTDALVLALLALGIGPDDEVITTPFTFIATAEAICRVGARPVFCDIDADSLNIDPRQLPRHITSRTRAVLVVHLYGLPAAMDEIRGVVEPRGLLLIEDCAQAFGATYAGKKVGTFGSAGCLSFFPAKNLGCFGDGGMVLTSDRVVAEKVSLLRNHGSHERYRHIAHGFNSRLDSLQAAVVQINLRHSESWIAQRFACARRYNELFSGCSAIQTPVLTAGQHSVNYYTIRVPAAERTRVQQKLQQAGIASAIHYPLSLHLQPVYAPLGYHRGDFPLAEQAQEQVLSLPLYPAMEHAAVEQVAAVVRRALGCG